MKHIRRILALLALCTATTHAHAIDFWHSDTVWAGQGMCAATFTFDSGGEPVSNLRVALSVIDKSGNNIDSFTLAVSEFGSLNADRYATELWESDLACEDSLTLVVTSASAVIDDKRQDLLRNQGLSIRQFTPFQIQMAGQPVATAEQAVQTPTNSLE